MSQRGAPGELPLQAGEPWGGGPAAARGGQAVARGGTVGQKETWSNPLVKGEKLLALAHAEPRSRYDVHRISAAAEKKGGGWVLRGEKVHVLDGHTADVFVVAARSGGEWRSEALSATVRAATRLASGCWDMGLNRST